MARIREKRPKPEKTEKSERKIGRKRLPRIHSLQEPGFNPVQQLAELKAIHFRRIR